MRPGIKRSAGGRWVVFLALAAGVGPACASDEGAPPAGAIKSEACAERSVGPRQLRLLTRAEYDATARDLLGNAVSWGIDAAACTDDTKCAITTESCVAQLCQADPCAVVTFMFAAGGASYDSVHVAGSFNDWAGTVAGGGWPLAYSASLDSWVGKRSVSDGDHTYKIVIDEQTWLTDPNGAGTVEDGLGGLNSMLGVACAGVPDPPMVGAFEPAADFPVESRPTGFPFDNAAASGLVTATHVERYLRAAEAIANRTDLNALTQCNLDDGDTDCLRQWVQTFAGRAFRRPLQPDHVDSYATMIAAQANPRLGVMVALRTMLSSPMFLYRQELGEVGGEGYAQLDGWEVASALSYFLWGTMPDDTLFDAAAAGSLDARAGIEQQARRLVNSDRARDRLGEFAAQWLGIERVATVDKNSALFPEFDDQLAAAMLAETKAFVASVVFDGAGTYQELLLSGKTVAEGRLRDLYGTSDGTLPPRRRAGLLAQASVLASYSHSDQTSPIRRGVFVRERLLCAPLPAPPPDAATIPVIDPNASTRDRFAQHSADPACSGCHRLIDPVGFAFEHFDAIGQFRETEEGLPIDPSGSVIALDGEDPTHNGLVDLANLLAASGQAPACFATNALRFALGALETKARACDVETLAQSFAEAEYDVRELLVAITQLDSFSSRSTP